MPKKLLARVLGKLPDSVQTSIRACYWCAKSALLYKHLFNILDLGWTLQTGITLRARSQGEWWVYNDIFVNREYDPPILKTLESHRAGRPLTVLDLGANVGYFSLRIVDLARQSGAKDVILDLTMVEGSPKVFRELQGRMESQRLPEVRIRRTHGLVRLRAGSGIIEESVASVGFIDLGELMKDQQIREPSRRLRISPRSVALGRLYLGLFLFQRLADAAPKEDGVAS